MIATSCNSIKKTLLCLEARFLSDMRFHPDYKGVCPTVNKTTFDVSAKAGLRIRTAFPLQAVSPLSQFDCLSCTQSSK